jgi:hypothetical protein
MATGQTVSAPSFHQRRSLGLRLRQATANLSLVSLQHQRNLAMSKTTPTRRLASKPRPQAFSAATWAEIQAIFDAAQSTQRRERRFSFYDYLGAVYRAYRRWKRLSMSRKTARQVGRHFQVPSRDHGSPIRILIEATLPEAGGKQHSRWVRALQFASANDITSQGLLDFFRSNGGVAGCASLAAARRKKRRSQRHRSVGPLTSNWAEF